MSKERVARISAKVLRIPPKQVTAEDEAFLKVQVENGKEFSLEERNHIQKVLTAIDRHGLAVRPLPAAPKPKPPKRKRKFSKRKAYKVGDKIGYTVGSGKDEELKTGVIGKVTAKTVSIDLPGKKDRTVPKGKIKGVVVE